MRVKFAVLGGLILGCLATAWVGAQEPSGTLVTFEKAVHFTSPGGEDVVAAPGRYQVEQQGEGQLRLVSDTSKDTLEIKAEAATHDEPVTAPVALSVQADEEDIHHLVLLLQGGKSLDAVGSYTGIKSRGTVMLRPLSSPQLALAFQRAQNPRFGQFMQKAPAAVPEQRPPQFQVVPPTPPLTWDRLWADVWTETTRLYEIKPASTVLRDPSCQGDLQFDLLVRNTIIAISLQKYGDAIRFMGLFQNRSLCLPREGVRGLEFALTMYISRAVSELPPPGAHAAVAGVLNLGMLTFDQIQYTKRSWWLLSMSLDYRRIQPYMLAYPRKDLGLWLYDFNRNTLVQIKTPDAIDRLMWSMQRMTNFGDGTCPLLDIIDQGMVCKPKIPGAGGSPSAKGGGGLQGFPTGHSQTAQQRGLACLMENAATSGQRGTLACMDKAIAGFRPDLSMTPSDLLRAADHQQGIVDKMCARSQEAGTGSGTDSTASDSEKKNEPNNWEKIQKQVDDACAKFPKGCGLIEYAWEVVKAKFFNVPQPIAALEGAASEEGANAGRGYLQMRQGQSAQSEGLKGSDDDMAERIMKKRENRVVTNPTKRTMGDDILARLGFAWVG